MHWAFSKSQIWVWPSAIFFLRHERRRHFYSPCAMRNEWNMFQWTKRGLIHFSIYGACAITTLNTCEFSAHPSPPNHDIGRYNDGHAFARFLFRWVFCSMNDLKLVTCMVWVWPETHLLLMMKRVMFLRSWDFNVCYAVDSHEFQTSVNSKRWWICFFSFPTCLQ